MASSTTPTRRSRRLSTHPADEPPGRPRGTSARTRRPPASEAAAAGSDPLPTGALLRRIEIKVLRRLDGFLFGDVTGVFYGPSLDLAEVREYQPGDEVRRIDWFVTARTGTLHVRQYREEREIRGWMVVDRSPSMDFGTRHSLKSQVAREFAVTAASVLSRQGNKIGSIAFAPGGTSVVPPGTGRMQVLRVLESLTDRPGRGPAVHEPGRRGALAATAPRAHAGGRAPAPPGSAHDDPLAAALARINRTVRRRSLVFVVSDFLAKGDADPQRDPAWARELGRLAARHDVIAVRVSDPAEHALPDVGDLRVRDPETGRELWLDTSDPRVRHAHAQLVETRERMLKRVLRSSGADLLQLSTEHEIVRPLLAFVRRRKGRRQEGART